MTRVLLVEDEPALARALATGLRDADYVVDVVHDGESALAGVLTAPPRYAAVLLDLRLPRMGGLEVLRALRGRGDTTPVLVVSACDAKGEVIAGLDAGADDYVTKPFALDELLARLRALLRRAGRAALGEGGKLRVADLELDPRTFDAWRGGRGLGLSRLEFRLLEHLLRHAGHVQSKDRLAAAVWNDDASPESNALEVHVSSL
ncbi:MAG: response regulator transcription factor, partial [Gemmatimonadetes bacterium]|nr:response regulator transcription factor [Gemmatimonadota bacterium]